MCEIFFSFCFFKQNKSTLLFSLILNINNEAKKKKKNAEYKPSLEGSLKWVKKHRFLVAKKLYHK